MLAITISCGSPGRSIRSGNLGAWAPNTWQTASLLTALLFAEAHPLFAQSPDSEADARKIYQQAQERLGTGARTNVMADWQFGRAAYDLADMMSDNYDRAKVAQAGIDACRDAIATDPQSAAAHYYLALDLGELARSKKLGALKLIREMERELLKAEALNPLFDYAGPARALGVLYVEAPGWPAGVGSRTKARAHLEKAVQLKPEFPENHLCLGEAYVGWGELKNLEHELEILNRMTPAAKAQFPPEHWAGSWKDWDSRVQKLDQARERLAASPVPHHGL